MYLVRWLAAQFRTVSFHRNRPALQSTDYQARVYSRGLELGLTQGKHEPLEKRASSSCASYRIETDR